MENIKREEKKTWKRSPDEIRMMTAMVSENVNRLQIVLRGEALYVRDALDIISLASSLSGFHLDREDIMVHIEGCDGRRLWMATINEIRDSIFQEMLIRRVYAHDGDCTIVLYDYTEEPEEEEKEDE